MTDVETSWLRVREHGVEVRIRVVTRASRDRIDGLHGDRVKVRLTAPPVGGEANDALIRFIARAAGVAPSRGRVVVGSRERSKTLLFVCARPAEVAGRLRAAVEARVDKSRERP